MISVIIPVHNRAHTLIRALESVRHQTLADWELILVDDGSSDETASTANAWIKQHQLSERAHVLRHEQNRGVSAARNTGARAASREWLAFLDSDDEWLPSRLQQQWPLTKDFFWIHGEEIWIRNGVRVNAMKKHTKNGGRLFSRCVELCCVSPSAVLLKRDLFFELGGFREDFPVCEDFELWLRLAARYEAGFVSEPILRKYGGHEDQLSRRWKAMDYFRVKALRPFLDNAELSLEEKNLVRNNIRQRCAILLKGYKKYGRSGEEVRDVRKWYDEVS